MASMVDMEDMDMALGTEDMEDMGDMVAMDLAMDMEATGTDIIMAKDQLMLVMDMGDMVMVDTEATDMAMDMVMGMDTVMDMDMGTTDKTIQLCMDKRRRCPFL